jgi:hypothetical protein
MKYIITESKLEKVAIKYLNKFYGDLEEYRTDEYPDTVFFIKGKKIYMEQGLESGRLYVGYDIIWTDLKTIFSLEAPEIQEIITKWVEETYKLEGVKSRKSISPSFNRWRGLNILTI